MRSPEPEFFLLGMSVALEREKKYCLGYNYVGCAMAISWLSAMKLLSIVYVVGRFFLHSWTKFQ